MRQATFWDGRAAKYDEDIRTHDSLYIRTITGTTSLLTNSDTVLDLGGGSGEIGLDIARHVQRVHGIDVSTKMIELANQKAHDRSVSNVEFSKAGVLDRMLGDAFDRMLAEGSFSAVTAFNVFHLVDDIHGVLARLRDVLEPGGLLVSQTPCLGERNWLVRAFLRVAQWTGFAPPIRSMTFAELEAVVSGNGFEILESEVWDEKSAVQRVVARKEDSPQGHLGTGDAEPRSRSEESGDAEE